MNRNMNDVIWEFETLEKEILGAQEELNRVKGKMDYFLKLIKEEFGFDCASDAKDYLAATSTKIRIAKESINTELQKIKEEFEEQSKWKDKGDKKDV